MLIFFLILLSLAGHMWLSHKHSFCWLNTSKQWHPTLTNEHKKNKKNCFTNIYVFISIFHIFFLFLCLVAALHLLNSFASFVLLNFTSIYFLGEWKRRISIFCHCIKYWINLHENKFCFFLFILFPSFVHLSSILLQRRWNFPTIFNFRNIYRRKLSIENEVMQEKVYYHEWCTFQNDVEVSIFYWSTNCNSKIRQKKFFFVQTCQRNRIHFKKENHQCRQQCKTYWRLSVLNRSVWLSVSISNENRCIRQISNNNKHAKWRWQQNQRKKNKYSRFVWDHGRSSLEKHKYPLVKRKKKKPTTIRTMRLYGNFYVILCCVNDP